tara:strand:- start:1243 stop:2241 length:999 start_codon:yes stop_codon:yes gene_type:complete
MIPIEKTAMNPLTTEELAFFKHFGYLIKPKVLNASTCNELVDLMWQSAPASLQRHDAQSYQPVPKADWSDDSLRFVQDDKWQYRALGTDQPLIDVMTHPQLWQWGEQLLGNGNIRAPTPGGEPMGSKGPAWPGGPVDPQFTDGVRGIYATLPNPGRRDAADALHTDGHPFHFSWVCLLEDCPPESGAFKVWPGSHRRFYPLFPMPFDQTRIPFYDHLPSHKGILHSQAYLDEVKAVEADTDAVDVWGSQGDVILWHHRLGHMAGHHKGHQQSIRQALLFDYNHIDLDAMRCDPTPTDPWRHWSAALRAADITTFSEDLMTAQRLPASAQHAP